MFDWLASRFGRSSSSVDTGDDGGVRVLTRAEAAAATAAQWHAGDAPAREVAVKVVVVGAPAVGKTSLVYRFAHGCASAAYYPTVGVDVVSVRVAQRRTPRAVRIDLWDVPLPELRGASVPRILDGAAGIAYVFSNASAESIDAVDAWRRAVRASRGNSSNGECCPSVLIAHKADLKKSLLTGEQLDHYCAKGGLAFWARTTLAEPATVLRALARLCDRALVHQLACEQARAAAEAVRERERPARIRIDPAVISRATAVAASRGTAASPARFPRPGVPAPAAAAKSSSGETRVSAAASPASAPMPEDKETETETEEESVEKKGEEMARRVEDEYEQLHRDLEYVLGHPCMAPGLWRHVTALDAQRAAECARLAAALRGAHDAAALARAHYQHRTCAAKWQRLVRQLVDELGAATSPAATPPPPGPVGRASPALALALSLSLSLSPSPALSPALSPASSLLPPAVSAGASPAALGCVARRPLPVHEHAAGGGASLPVCVPGACTPAAACGGGDAARSPAPASLATPRRMGFAFRSAARASGSTTPSPGRAGPLSPLFPGSPAPACPPEGG